MTATVALDFAQAILAMTVLGYFVIDLLLPSKNVSRGFVWALAPGLGAGVCSFILFLFRRPMFTVERGLLVVLCFVWLWRRGIRRPDLSGLSAWRTPLLGVLFAGGLGIVLAQSLERVTRIPHGGTDAFAIWNSHSRYLLRDGPNWQHHIQNTFHPDYPLLLPLSVARLWRYASEVPEIAGMLGVMFAFFTVALLAATLAELRGISTGILMGLTLLTTSDYMFATAFQEADVPLSLFMLGTTALLCLYFERPQGRSGVLMLAGFMAGCAAWTKNEGSLFLAVALAVLTIPLFWNPRVTVRRLALFSAGFLLPLAVVLYFKVGIAPQTDLFQSRNYDEVVQKVFDIDRHYIAFGNILRYLWTFGGWAIHPLIPFSAFLAWRGVSREALRNLGWRTGVAIFGIVLLGYHCVYVFTPMEQNWHIQSSLPRLMMQLWPSVILLVGLAGRREDQPASPQSWS